MELMFFLECEFEQSSSTNGTDLEPQIVLSDRMCR